MPNALTSWKEIARYLGKGIRTVQRWEAVYGLPVRRTSGSDHRSVLAIPAELDEWLRGQHTNSQSELESLRREAADLRAEVLVLRRQLERIMASPRPYNNGLHPRADLLIRSPELILETTQVRKQTRAAIDRARMLRLTISN